MSQKRLPPDWTALVLAKLQPANGIWEDFQCAVDTWDAFYKQFTPEYIDPSLFPPRPTISDYSDDLSTTRSRC